MSLVRNNPAKYNFSGRFLKLISFPGKYLAFTGGDPEEI